MNQVRIELYSDTQTRPTAAMRRAMAEAPVGDEQHGEDPSVNRLCAMVAQLLGKEEAVFLPSGTMCNEIALAVHCRPGDEIIADESAHILNFEGGGPAAIAGAVIRTLPGRRGVFDADMVHAAVRPESRYFPRTRLVSVEQTANIAGGTVWPLATVEGVTAAAREHALLTHMDGARLMNAVVASGVAAHQFAAGFDSAWIDLSKGLGCPMGGVLAGSGEFIREAWRWKQRMGGALRQAGIVAAAGIHALEHHVERLAEDHANARRFAEIVREAGLATLEPDAIDTNMVFVELGAGGVSAEVVSARLAEQGIRIGALSETRLRAVTHLDVNRAQVEEAAHALNATIAELSP